MADFWKHEEEIFIDLCQPYRDDLLQLFMEIYNHIVWGMINIVWITWSYFMNVKIWKIL
jgi:hypothetical protein